MELPNASDDALHVFHSSSAWRCRIAERPRPSSTSITPVSARGRQPVSRQKPVARPNTLRINAFGSLGVVSDAGELTGAANQPRRLAILALLARAGDRGIQRDKILEILWTDVEPDQARRTFAKALHALRRDLCVDDAIVGGAADLRLNPDVFSSDVAEFDTAIAEGNLQRAVTLYTGPFLDAFRLHAASEFERWADTERNALARDYELALEKLGSAESKRGDHPSAVRWLRKLAAQDPLNARNALRLMRSLTDAGDRLGAVHHARVYEALVEQELDLPPDRDVVAFAERLRQEHAKAPAAPSGPKPPPAQLPPARVAAPQVPADAISSDIAPASGTVATATGTATPDALPTPEVQSACVERAVLGAAASGMLTIVEHAPQSAQARTSSSGSRRFGLWALVAALVPLVTAPNWATRFIRTPASFTDRAVIAVGRINDYREPASSELAGPLGDMLATNLARVPELRVLSTARMYELVSDARRAGDTTSTATVTAARRAGAGRLVDGALFQLADTRLRLDLRLVDLANGDVIVAHTVTGADPFALVDSATALLVAQAGANAPSGSVADVSTRSLVAYRLYEEGLRAYTGGHFAAADRLFRAATTEDSTFAMAAFYSARTALQLRNWPAVWQRFAVARRVANRATERERMLIDLEFRMQSYSPAVRALADSFVARFPHDVEGYRYVGIIALAQARFGDAVANLRRVVEMDSLGRGSERARCVGCEAMATLLRAYHAMDSLQVMYREARRWAALEPKSSASWREVAVSLALLDRSDEALAALRTSTAFSSVPDEPISEAHFRIRAADFANADRDLLDVSRSRDADRRSEMLWMLVISLRNQGRLEEALERAREFRSESPGVDGVPGAVSTAAIAEAQTLFERGDYARSAALFDSMASVSKPPDLESFAAKTRVWLLAHAATARYAMGDTAALRWMIDTMQVVGARSYIARDQRLHHYVRGLLLSARGRHEEAVTELREAMWSPTIGFTRVNHELGKLYLRLGRPREAVAVLQPALRGPLDASNYYITRTELHEQLGRAWLAAGRRDSAAVHLRSAADAWQRGDARFAARRDSAVRTLSRESGIGNRRNRES